MKESFFTPTAMYYRTNDFLSDRQTLVFIHGLSGSSSAWVKYERKFKDLYNIITLDINGHGKSPKSKDLDTYRIETLAQNIHELLCHLGIEKFTLISHSFGTIIALELIAKRKNSVLSAIFLSPIIEIRKTRLGKIHTPMLSSGFMKLIQILPAYKKVGHHIDYSKYEQTGDWNVRRIYADIHNTTLRVYLYCLKHIYDFDGNRYIDQLSMPILIIHGENDSLMAAENSENLALKIPHCKLAIISRANHILVFNNFNEVHEIIDSFIKDNS